MEDQHPKYQISFSNNTIGTLVQNYGENITAKYEDNLFKPIFFNIQEYIPSFIGRTLDLQQLDDTILKNQISAICGFGGIGKTELVRYYAWNNREKFDGNIVWINAEIPESMDSLFKKLALELLVPLMQNGINRLMDAIIRDIYYKLNRKKCLIIFDNAINQKIIGGFLPRRDETNIHIIITSQNREWIHNRIDLDVLTPEESQQFFKYNLKTLNNNLGNVERLAKELQYLPIALQQATSFINYKTIELHENFGVLQYIEEFEKKRLFEVPLPETHNSYDKTVYTTVSLTVDLINQTSKHPKLTLDILHVCSYLAPDNIPKFIFSQLNENTDVLNEAFHVLIKYSLLREFFNDKWCYNIHRLVQLSYRYINNPEGFCKTTIRKSLFLTTNKEMSRSPHSFSVLCFAMKDPQIDYGFYFEECPNQNILIFHLGLYDYFDGIKYLLNIIRTDYFSMGVEGAIEKGSFRIVKYICELHPKLFDLKTSYLGKSAAFGKINLMRYFIKNGADVNQLYKDTYPILVLAIVGNMKDGVKFLIKEGCNINLQNMQYAPMIFAVICKNLDILKILVENGGFVNTNCIKDNNDYLLHIAARQNNLPIIQYLIEKGAQINCVNKFNITPLHSAALKGHLQIVEYLIEKGADINILNVDGNSALYGAASEGYLPILQLLHKQGSDINLCGTNAVKSTPLLAASGNGHIDIVKYLLDNNCDKTINSIYFASANGHLPIVELLHKHGFQINVLTKENFSPLYGAAQNGYLDIVKFLLKNGADINQPTTELHTPLYTAVTNNHEEVVRFLVENGADVNFLTQNERTALFTSCFNGHLTIVKFLMDNNSDIDHVDNGGYSGLFVAAQNGHFDVVKQLIEANCDVYQTCKKKFTALHIAAQKGHLQIVEFLYETGLDLEDRTLDGSQAIHLAASNGHLVIVEFLLENGSEVDAVNNAGVTPLILAAFSGHQEVVKYLLDNNSDLDHVMNGGYSGLFLAAQNGHFDVVKQFIEANCNVHQTCKLGFNALHVAAEHGHLQIVEFLYKNGFDLDDRTLDGNQAIHLAAKNGHSVIVEFLLENGSHLDSVNH